ncbi:Srprb, partial [Symbiodinium sp. KB8]
TAPTKFGLKKLEVDEAFKRGLLENVLPAAAPEFNQVTEDGIVFRIYKIGSLEVRTMQEADEPEAIAVVFSSGTASWEGKAVDSEDVLRERLVKCKVYVEAMEQESQLHLAKDARMGCNFYIVLETEKKNRIVTEALGAGALSWVQNPHNLEDRNSLAKLLFTVDCKDEVYARDVKQFQRTLILPPSAGLRKHYAKAVYKFVSGRSFRGKWGGKLRRFAPPPQSGNLGLAALGRSSDFLNVMWLARKSSNKADLLKPKTPAYCGALARESGAHSQKGREAKSARAPAFDAALSMMDYLRKASGALEASLGVGSSTASVLTFLLILISVYVTLQIFQVVSGSGIRSRRSRGNAALILGPCGSGKTSVFFRLRDGEEVQTVSSLAPARDSFEIKAGEAEDQKLGPLEVVDFPGHLRMRGKANDMVKEARCIIYLVDAEDKPKLKDVAEHFYELFTHPDVLELHTPMLVACNKSDLTSARTEKFIVEEIEREIEQMRVSRAATLEGQDQADSYLGVDGEKFKLLEHAPCPIQTCRISAKKNQLDPLYDFLLQQFA